MAANKSFDEVEKLLQEVGAKIEELIAKAAEATGDVKIDIENKIRDLKSKKDLTEKEYHKKRSTFDKSTREKFKSAEPDFQKSKDHFSNAIHHLVQGFKSIFSK